MAFLFGALLGLVLGVAVVMAFARLENSRAEQRRELVRATNRQFGHPLPPLLPVLSWRAWFQ